MKLSSASFLPLCLLGTLILGTSVSHAANIDLDWFISTYADKSAQVGDTITFEWDEENPHNAHIYPSGSCDDEAGIIVVGQNSPASYTFKEGDLGNTIFFGCTISGHCAAGQNVKITVTDAEPETPSPTKASTKAPTAAPTKASIKPSTKVPTASTSAASSSQSMLLTLSAAITASIISIFV